MVLFTYHGFPTISEEGPYTGLVPGLPALARSVTWRFPRSDTQVTDLLRAFATLLSDFARAVGPPLRVYRQQP
jgi:hypothetical protein